MCRETSAPLSQFEKADAGFLVSEIPHSDAHESAGSH